MFQEGWSILLPEKSTSISVELCRRLGTPLIEGSKAIFVWYGVQPARLMGDFNDWDEEHPVALARRENNCWVYELDLPQDAYMEYIFLDEQRKRILDPYNRRIGPNGLGKLNNFFYMPGGSPTPWRHRQYKNKQVKVHHRPIPCHPYLTGNHRMVHFYQPPVSESSPLLVVWDGGEYLRLGHLVAIVENLIASGLIRPLALAMVDNSPSARFREYACSDATLGFLLDRLLPEAQKQLNLLDPQKHPGAFGVMGASLGGLMALYTGLRLPQIFGKVLAQSGAYTMRDSDFITSFMVDYGPVPPVHVWMDAGRFEGLLEANRRMHARLSARGYDVHYNEYNAGHNYTAWRNDLHHGLECLFTPENY